MPAEALQRFRTKYPEYNDLPDGDLATRILKKYPQYQDLFGDLATQPSPVRTIKDAWEPFAGPIGLLPGQESKEPGVGELLGGIIRGLPRFATEGIPAIAKETVSRTGEALSGGPPTIGQRWATSPWVPAGVPGGLDLAERAMRGYGALTSIAGELGPEQAKPLTEALVGNLPFLGLGAGKTVLPGAIGRRLAAREVSKLPPLPTIDPYVPRKVSQKAAKLPESPPVSPPGQPAPVPPVPPLDVSPPTPLPPVPKMEVELRPLAPGEKLPAVPRGLIQPRRHKAEVALNDFDMNDPLAWAKVVWQRGGIRPGGSLAGELREVPAWFRGRRLKNPAGLAPDELVDEIARARGIEPSQVENAMLRGLTRLRTAAGEAKRAEVLPDWVTEGMPPVRAAEGVPTRFEPTPAGEQGLIPGLPRREIPPTPLRPEGAQGDIRETPLFGQERAARERAMEGAQGSIQGGKPAFEATLYHGSGAPKEMIYSADVLSHGGGPILGPGKYYAHTERQAGEYGDIVTREKVTLQNPFILDSTTKWNDLLQESNAPHLDTVGRARFDDPEGIPAATARVQAWLRGHGHDGVVVKIPKGTDVNAQGESIKRLREAFTHEQVIVFDPPAGGQMETLPPGVPKGITPEQWAQLAPPEQKAFIAAGQQGGHGKMGTMAGLGGAALAGAMLPKFPTDLLPSRDDLKSSAKEAGQALMLAAPMFGMALGRQGRLPGVGGPTGSPSGIANSFRRTFAPASLGPEARQMAGVVRQEAGLLAQKTEQAAAEVKGVAKAVGRLKDPERYAFLDRMEHGQAQPIPPMQATADTLRKLLDERRVQVQQAKPGALKNYIQDYVPHLWKDPDKARDVFAEFLAKRPLAPGSFLKKRSLDYISYGLARGLELVDTNPVTLTLLRIREMDRFVMGQRIFDEIKQTGLAKFVKFGDSAPSGWARINDKIAKVYQFSEKEKGFIQRGEYYAPEQAALILNRYLSPGLTGQPAFDLFRGIGNTLNMAQLGLSGFHLAFTAMDSMTSRVALGIQQMGAGHPIRGAGNIAMGATPLTPILNYLKGSKVIQAYRHPGTQGALMDQVSNGVVKAGGRVSLDPFYYNSSAANFSKALREHRPLGVARHSFPALIEKMSWPIMGHLVPRMKLGVFHDLARFELERLGPGASLADERFALQRAWDSVDNRMGQLVYDNLFWNKTLKDLGLASVRSLGWNVGTVRELGGGLSEIARAPKAALQGRFELTPKMAYTAALPFTVGLYGGMLTYLMTGEGPKELEDYFFPRTGQQKADGRDERLSLPSYMRDVYGFAHQPWQTVKHKVNPGLSTVIEMLENEDFYGAAIRNPNDPVVLQAFDEFRHVIGAFEPFSFRAYHPLPGMPQPSYPWASMFGATPAPAYIERSAEQVAAAEQRRTHRQLRRKGQYDSDSTVRELLRESLE